MQVETVPVWPTSKRNRTSQCPAEGHKNHRWGPDGRCEYCGTVKSVASKGERRPRRQAPGRLTKARIKEILSLLITGTQSILLAFGGERVEDDLLEDWEVSLLVDALTEEVDQSNRLRALILKVDKGNRHARLIITVAVIIIPRLSRRGILPAGNAELARAFALAMEPGRAYGDHRGDGIGEIDPSSMATEGAAVRDSDPHEGGYSDVPSPETYEDTQEFAEPKL